jgi:hypothetical protein
MATGLPLLASVFLGVLITFREVDLAHLYIYHFEVVVVTAAGRGVQSLLSLAKERRTDIVFE